MPIDKLDKNAEVRPKVNEVINVVNDITYDTPFIKVDILPGEEYRIPDATLCKQIIVYYSITAAGYINNFVIDRATFGQFFYDVLTNQGSIYVRINGNNLTVSSVSTGDTTKVTGLKLIK